MTQSKAAPPARTALVAIGLSGLLLLAAGPAQAQGGPNAPGATSPGEARTTEGALQQLAAPTGQDLSAPTPDSFKGSVVTGKATDQILDLSLDDAIARGLRQNLGLILQTTSQQSAHGQQLEQLQALLPTVTADASIEVEQVNLAAFGLKFPGLNPIIGPFQVVDFRAYLTQSLVNVPALENYIAAKHNFAAAKLTAADARDMVVLTVGNAYLLCIADAARIEAVHAELATSKVTFDQATDAHDAGISPRLDVLRAQVDYQNVQQNLISATNQLAKDKLSLARVIGLPLDQAFRITDTEPYTALDNLDSQAAFAQALKNRKDLAASGEQVAAARAQQTAAFAGQLPSVKFSGDYGDLGTTPGHSHRNTSRHVRNWPTRFSRSTPTSVIPFLTFSPPPSSSKRQNPISISRMKLSAKRSSASRQEFQTTCPCRRRRRRPNWPTISTSAPSTSTTPPSSPWPAPWASLKPT
jgi:outer membrane protein TolC